MMLIGWLSSLAHHFEINGVFYNVISTTEVEVTYKGSSYYEYDDEYNGRVVILSLVEYGGFTYSVISIGEGAFMECSSLTSVEIPYSVTSIGINAFANCTSLTSIVVDAGNSKYDSRNGCNAIIETASNTLIAGCQNTIIPNNVTSIGDYAFNWCVSLTSIEIPNSVTSIGEWAFGDCESLTSIVVDSGNTKYDSRNGCNAIIETASNTLIAGCQNTIIPNSVTSIGEWAFNGCTSLTSIKIPNSVTSIGDNAFNSCTGLTSVIIGNSVTSIGYGAFAYCSSLTSIEIPNSVTSIGGDAFEDCSSLTRIICTATTPPMIESDTFSEYSAFLFVPIGCKATYEVTDYWENFNNIIEVTLDAPVTLNDNVAIVATIGENIVVKNAMVGSVVRVYTTDGAMIASEVATEGDVIIEAPAKGIYVVTVGKQTVKVII